MVFVGFDADAVSKRSKTVSKISNTRSHLEFMNGLSVPKAATLVKHVSSWTSTFCELMEAVEIGRVPQV